MKRAYLFCCLPFLFLFGCVSSSPLVTSLRDSSAPKEKYSVLTLDYTMSNVRIDGKSVGSGGGGGLSYKTPMVLLPEGEHSIVARYQRDISNSTTIQAEYAGDMSLAYTFKPGRFYLLYPVFDGSRVSIMVTDETDPFVWERSQERGAAQARNTAAREALAKIK
jgi:hypothetical protein